MDLYNLQNYDMDLGNPSRVSTVVMEQPRKNSSRYEWSGRLYVPPLEHPLVLQPNMPAWSPFRGKLGGPSGRRQTPIYSPFGTLDQHCGVERLSIVPLVSSNPRLPTKSLRVEWNNHEDFEVTPPPIFKTIEKTYVPEIKIPVKDISLGKRSGHLKFKEAVVKKYGISKTTFDKFYGNTSGQVLTRRKQLIAMCEENSGDYVINHLSNVFRSRPEYKSYFRDLSLELKSLPSSLRLAYRKCDDPKFHNRVCTLFGIRYQATPWIKDPPVKTSKKRVRKVTSEGLPDDVIGMYWLLLCSTFSQTMGGNLEDYIDRRDWFGLITLVNIAQTEGPGKKFAIGTQLAGMVDGTLYNYACKRLSEADFKKYFSLEYWLGEEELDGSVGIKKSTKSYYPFNFTYSHKRDPNVSEELLNVVLQEGFEDSHSVFKRIKKSPLVVRTGYMLIEFLSKLMLHLDPTEHYHFLVSSAKSWLQSFAEGGSFLSALGDLFAYWRERIAKFWETGDFMDLFELPPEEQMLEDLNKHLDILANVQDSKNPQVDVDAARLVIRRALKFRHPLVMSAASQLTDLISTISSRLELSRIPPLGLILTGLPGLGKTMFVQQFCSFIKQVSGIDDAVEIKQDHVLADHQTPQPVCLVYCLNDWFSVKDEATPGGGTTLTLMQGLVDSAPFKVNAASLSDKEMAYLCPDYVMATTNAKSFTFSNAVGAAQKLDRRYHILDFQINDAWWEEHRPDIEPEDRPLEVANGYVPGMVKWTLGDMRNSPGVQNVKMDFTIQSNKRIYTNMGDVFMELMRMQKKKASDYTSVSEQCKCKCSPCVCEMVKNAQAAFYPETLQIVKHEGLEFTDYSLFGLLGILISMISVKFVFLGDRALITVNALTSAITGASDVAIQTERNISKSILLLATESSYWRSYSKHWDKLSTKLLYSLKFIFVIGTLVAGWKLLRKNSSSEGASVSSLSNLEPEDVYVRPYSDTNQPWLSRTDLARGIQIKRRSLGMFCLMVSHGLFVLPRHFFTGINDKDPIQPNETFWLNYSGKKVMFKFSPEMVWYPFGSSRDVAFMFAPGVKSLGKSVYSDLPATCCASRDIDKVGPMDAKVHIWYERDKRITYHADTKPGDCGLPLTDPTGKIYGFHIGKAGHTIFNSIPVAEAISRKEVDSALEEFQRRNIHVEHRSHEIPSVLQEGNYTPGLAPQSDIGKWEKHGCGRCIDADHIPLFHARFADQMKPSFAKTTLYPYFSANVGEYAPPHSKKAIKLDDGTWKSPSIYRMETMRDTEPEPNLGKMLIAADHMLAAIPQPSKRLMPVDLYVAVCGHPANVLFNPRDNEKAIGFTLKKMNLTNTTAFTQVDGEWKMDDRVRLEFERLEREVASGFLPLTISKATLKDEVYPKEKSDVGKGRLFYVNDLCLNLLLRKYLLPLITYLMEHAKETGVNVTMNAGSNQFKELYLYLNKFGEGRSFDGDQKSFDLRHCCVNEVLAGFYQSLALKLGYNLPDAQMSARVFLTASRYVLEMAGNFYVCGSGLTSGRSDTIIMNCLALGLAARYSLVKPLNLKRLPREHFSEPIPVSLVLDYVAIVNTGDDNITSVSPSLAWDGNVMAADMKELGYEMTSGDKVSEISFKRLEDIWYLQRNFRKVILADGQERVYAPLKEKSMFKALSYCVGGGGIERDLSTARCMLYEAFMHGEEKFNWFLGKFQLAFPDENFHDYDYYDREYESGTFSTWNRSEPQHLVVPSTDKFHFQITEEGMMDRRSLPERCDQVEALSKKSPFILGPVSKTLMEISGYSIIVNPTASLNTDENNNNTEVQAPIVDVGGINLETMSMADGIRGLRPALTDAQVEQILSRPRLLTTYTVGVPEPIGGFDVLTLWKAQAPVNDILKYYGLFRGNLRLTFSFTGSNQLMGRTRAYLVPYKQTTTTYGTQQSSDVGFMEAFPNDVVALTSSLPHVDMDLSMAETMEIKLPFPGSRTYLKAGEGDWNLHFKDINPPKMANGSTPVPVLIQVHAFYEGVELNRIQPEGAVELPPAALSRMLSYASAVASKLPFSWATPVSKVTALGSQIASTLGFSRPPNEPQDVSVYKHVGNFALSSGMPDFGYTLATDPAVQSDVSVSIPLAVEGETSLDFFKNKETELISNVAALQQVTLEPGSFTSSSNIRVQQTALCFMSSFFNFWTGPISLKVQVLSSPLVRWRIGVVIVPPGITAPLSYPGDGTFLTTIIEVAGTTEVDIEIPYLYNNDFTEFAFQHIETLNLNSTRVVYFSLMDPTGPSPTPVFPYVNYWVKAGPTFSVGVPTLEHLVGYSIFSESGPGDMSLSHFGENIGDLLNLTRRVSKYVKASMSASHNGTTIPVAIQCPGIVFSNAEYVGFDIRWTFASYLASAYLGERGGWNYKIHKPQNAHQSMVLNVLGQLNTVSAAAPVDAAMDYGTRGCIVYDARDAYALEVRVPDRNIHNFRFTRNVMPNGDDFAEWLVFQSDDGSTEAEFWVGASDDYTVGGYLFPPILSAI